MYLLEFGATASDLGTILLVASCTAPLLGCLIGRLMDANVFIWRFFPTKTWGKRAPWALTHIICMAVLSFLFFWPPSYSRWALNAWYTLIWFVGYWTVGVVINAFEAARVELCPSKEERIQLELFAKVTVGIGSGIGSGAVTLVLTFPSQAMMLLSGAIASAGVLLGLACVGVLRDAKGNAVDTPQQYSWVDLRATISSPIVMRMMLIRMLIGSYEAILYTAVLYQLTFVYKLSKGDRVYWALMFAGAVVIVEYSTAPVWTWLFTKSTRCMLYLPVVLRVIGAVATPLILLSSKEVSTFIVYTAVWRFCQSSTTFWRIAASAWVCDHDAGNNEGLLCGCFMMVTDFGRAFSVAVMTLGLDWAGYVATNCLQEEDEALAEQCELDKIRLQPESLETYIIVMVTAVAPLMDVLIAALIIEFPIKPGSKLLADILERQKSMSPGNGTGVVAEPQTMGMPHPGHEEGRHGAPDPGLEEKPPAPADEGRHGAPDPELEEKPPAPAAEALGPSGHACSDATGNHQAMAAEDCRVLASGQLSHTPPIRTPEVTS